MFDFIEEVVAPFIVVFLVITIGIGLLLGSGAIVYSITDPRSCAAQADALGLKHSWGFWEGCFVVSKEGEHLPLKTYLHRTVEQNVRIRTRE